MSRRAPTPPPTPPTFAPGELRKRSEKISARIEPHLREQLAWFVRALEHEQPGVRVSEAEALVILLRRALALEVSERWPEAAADAARCPTRVGHGTPRRGASSRAG